MLDNMSQGHCMFFAGAADGAKLVVSVLSEVAGAATDMLRSAESVLSASQAVEAVAAELRREVEASSPELLRSEPFSPSQN